MAIVELLLVLRVGSNMKAGVVGASAELAAVAGVGAGCGRGGAVEEFAGWKLESMLQCNACGTAWMTQEIDISFHKTPLDEGFCASKY
jgi:hypothetical protein